MKNTICNRGFNCKLPTCMFPLLKLILKIYENVVMSRTHFI